MCKLKDGRMECKIVLRNHVKGTQKVETLRCALCKLKPGMGDNLHATEFGDVFKEAYFKNSENRKIFICEYCREAIK